MINDYALCAIHGRFYSGWCECPICKEMKEIDKENLNEHQEKN